jgi:hypothetical protein
MLFRRRRSLYGNEMRTAFELPADKLDGQDREFLEAIREHGWFGTRVFDPDGESADFTYSTGHRCGIRWAVDGVGTG